MKKCTPITRDHLANLNGKSVEDEDEVRLRMAARIIEELSAAGYTCDLRYSGMRSH